RAGAGALRPRAAARRPVGPGDPRGRRWRRVKRRLQLAAGILISVVAVWFSMRDVNAGAVWQALRGANYVGFVAAVATTLIGFWIRALRWRSLISSPKP